MQVSIALVTLSLKSHKKNSQKNGTNFATYAAEAERAVRKDLIALLSITDKSILQFHS